MYHAGSESDPHYGQRVDSGVPLSSALVVGWPHTLDRVAKGELLFSAGRYQCLYLTEGVWPSLQAVSSMGVLSSSVQWWADLTLQ